MEAQPVPSGSPGRRRRLAAAGLVTGGVLAGAVLATSLGASADTTSSTASSTASSAGSGATSRPDPGGSKPVRSDEKAVPAAQDATLRAAALKAVPGGSVIRIETDAGDGAYGAHMRKSDGSLVTVKFDAKMSVIGVEDGMGKGDPKPSGSSGSSGSPGSPSTSSSSGT